MTISRHRLIACIILLVALILRLWQLGGKSLWLDEATSWHFAKVPLQTILTNTEETNPPVYYALLHGWMHAFGDSETSMRFLSLIFGMLGVALMGWVGTLIGGKEAGLWAMGLMALMTMPVKFSQTIRSYSLFLAAVLASYGSLLMWIKTRKLRWSVSYVFSTIIMCYAHNYWMFTIFAQQLYVGWLILRRRVHFWPWVLLTGLVVAGYLPWLMVLLKQASTLQNEGFWIGEPHKAIFWKVFQLHFFFDVASFEAFFFLGWALLGIWAFRTKVKTNVFNPGLLFASWFICPILIPFFVSKISTPILVPRYTIAAAPVAYLLVVFAMTRYTRWWRAVSVIIIGLLSLHNLATYYSWEWEDWRQAIAVVTKQAQPDDALLVMASSISPRATPFEYYYHGQVPYHAWPSKGAGLKNVDGWQEQVKQQLAGHPRVWLVMRDGTLLDSSKLVALIRSEYPKATLVYEQQFPQKVAVYGYQLK